MSTRRPSACRAPALRRSAGRTLRDPTAAGRARSAGRPRRASLRSTNGRTWIASSTPRSRARTRCSAVNGPADPGQPRVRPRPAHAGEDVEQHVDPLPRDRAADVQQLHAAPARSQHPRRLDVRRGVRPRARRPCRVPLGITDEPILREARERHQRAARRLAVARHVRGRGAAGQDPARHPAERQRAPLLVRLQDRSEGVEVVAGDERAAGGQPVQQMRVAVIDQMVDVEAAAAPRARADSRRTAPRRDRSRAPARALQASRTRQTERRIDDLRDVPRVRCATSMSATDPCSATALRRSPR